MIPIISLTISIGKSVLVKTNLCSICRRISISDRMSSEGLELMIFFIFVNIVLKMQGLLCERENIVKAMYEEMSSPN